MNDEEEKREHYRNAVSNYSGVLAIMDRWKDKVVHGPNEPLPTGWESEPFLLLGNYLSLLNLNEHEKQVFRESTLAMVERHGG